MNEGDDLNVDEGDDDDLAKYDDDATTRWWWWWIYNEGEAI